MNSVPMLFKDFEFPVNPQKIEIRAVSDTKQILVPFGTYELQELGVKPLLISGEGAFEGENAEQSFESLFELFMQGGAGELLFAGAQPMLAIMTKLAKGLEPLENTISYSFEFVELVQKLPLKFVFEQYHIVREGEILWHVARDYAVPIESLLKLNEQVSNPWCVEMGDRVRVQ